jgi:hypothetical protein
MITMEYAYQFMDYVKVSAGVMVHLDNHGYFRELVGTSVTFFPKLPGEKFHSIGMTPAQEQSGEAIQRDVANGRILLIAEASNSSGDCIILEDDTGYMTLTGYLSNDLITYCHRVVKAIIHVTGAAESLGMTPHDYISQIAD